jgi:transposase-like protein
MTDKKELQAQALALYTAGATTADVAEKFGISRVTAWRWVTAARNEIAKSETLDNLARLWLESARLDALGAAVAPAALAGDVKAVRAALAVIEARIALHGVAAPRQANITIETAQPTRYELVQAQVSRMSDAELAQASADAEARLLAMGVSFD